MTMTKEREVKMTGKLKLIKGGTYRGEAYTEDLGSALAIKWVRHDLKFDGGVQPGLSIKAVETNPIEDHFICEKCEAPTRDIKQNQNGIYDFYCPRCE
jgi:hypothetical protein